MDGINYLNKCFKTNFEANGRYGSSMVAVCP